MNMHCSQVQLITIETIIFSAMLSDCSAAEFKHPPTFQDYQHAKAIDSKEAPEMDAQVAFFEAAAFTPQELGQILERGVKEELIGAGISVKAGDSKGIQLLRRAGQNHLPDPLPLAALSYEYLSFIGNNARESFTDTEVEDTLREFIRADANNALPFYLMAWFKVSQGKFGDATAALEQAASKPYLKTYLSNIRQSVILACESAGFPKFTARMVACGQAPGVASLSKLAKTVVENPAFTSDSIKPCLQMGQALEKDSTFFIEELVAYSIQTRALKKLDDARLASEEQRFKRRKEYIKRATAFLESAPVRKLPESRWLAYLDDMFRFGESRAAEGLAGELGQKF